MGGWELTSVDVSDLPSPWRGWKDAFWFGRVSSTQRSVRSRGIVVPHWFLVILFATMPLTRLGLFIRRRRRKVEGRCAKCGYDLRATPERCPECGTAPDHATFGGC
jgi:hypothetical protein